MTGPARHKSELARETLAYIRDTMESASRYTAVSGLGLVGVGVVGVVASWASWAAGAVAPLEIWIPAAVVALVISGLGNASKAKLLGVPVWSGAFRKMAWGLVPALFAGAVLTFALTADSAYDLLPGAWLAIYGAGVTASGTFSVRAVRWMGLTLLGLGGVALMDPALGLGVLALGFGGVHLAFGLYIAARYGG